MRFSEKFDTAAALREMIRRAGFKSAHSFAVACGLRGQSSVQRYLSSEHFGDKPLPSRFLSQAARALAGRGSPPITRMEVMALGDIDINEIIASETARDTKAGIKSANALIEDGPPFRAETTPDAAPQPISEDFLAGIRLALEATGIDPVSVRGQLIISKLILRRQGINPAEIGKLASQHGGSKNH